jgi:hypothetical protein
MARITWDNVGERYYETGIDRGVLYLPSEPAAVAWNGLTSMEEDFSESVSEPLYIDGSKYLDATSDGDFKGVLKAFTYPDEFLQFDGIEVIDGVLVDGQIPVRFGLSYRTRIGNDVDGSNHGYKIHILYNLTAVADMKSYQTQTTSLNPIEFSWSISGVPENVPNFRSTVHAIFDSRLLPSFLLTDIEDMLYGSPESEPYLPSLAELVAFVQDWASLMITDHGDGTWSAEEHSTADGAYITMLDVTTFQIDAETVVYLDADTYTITDVQ